MCTATLLPQSPHGSGFRLVTNRDEQHTRAEALPPRVRRYGERHAMLPVDPQSDGTWIAVNDTGLAITLLNLNLGDDQPDPAGRASRGGVITSLMQHGTAEAAAQHAGRLDAAAMMPFRLLIADPRSRDNLAVVRSDGRGVTVAVEPLGDAPRMLTSSGLGDHLVEPPRRGLFDADPPRDPAAQDAFHRHRWPGRSHLSVAMHRDDARTVSRTVVEVGPDAVTMTYTPVAFDGTEGETFTAALPRAAEAKA